MFALIVGSLAPNHFTPDPHVGVETLDAMQTIEYDLNVSGGLMPVSSETITFRHFLPLIELIVSMTL